MPFNACCLAWDGHSPLKQFTFMTLMGRLFHASPLSPPPLPSSSLSPSSFSRFILSSSSISYSIVFIFLFPVPHFSRPPFPPPPPPVTPPFLWKVETGQTTMKHILKCSGNIHCYQHTVGCESVAVILGAHYAPQHCHHHGNKQYNTHGHYDSHQ